MEISVKILNERTIQNHRVPNTRDIRYSFTVTSSGQTLIAGESTAKKNVHGVFLDMKDLEEQVADPSLRRPLVIAIKEKLRNE